MALKEVRIALAHPDGLSEQGLMDAKALEITILNSLCRFTAIERNGIALNLEAMAYYQEARDLCERYENEYHNQDFLTVLAGVQDRNGFIWEALDTVKRIERGGRRDPAIYKLKAELLMRLGLEEEAGIAYEPWIDWREQITPRQSPPDHCLTDELYRLKMTYGHPKNLPQEWIPKKKKGEDERFVPQPKY